MTEYQIQPPLRRCSVTGRELKSGEKFFTVLLEEKDHFVRQDFSQEAWQGPPPNSFSFWASKIPPDAKAQKPVINEELLLDCFDRLENQEDPQKIQFRYVLGLLLMRKKRFRFEDGKKAGNREVMVLRCNRTRKVYEVVNPQLSEEEIEKVQEEVYKLIGWQ